ncbi:hypothetical protein BO71DRAFT_72123 [Aspergillus ellipticus CBS 707.79]|uniref:EthD domain-containing protein n=1 Tax=Aspergillus ellipticus CBS 707.79 TaxID=1448320 RepID=A0A319D7Y0_9EURO|nr:hypothetical protein BO71DRAFT_72123 [Aspergillus ellipticus CBS 707.79]
MTYSLLLLCRRKAGLTPVEFENYFETKHVPLIRSLTEDTFPIHQRFYMHREEQDGYPAKLLLGSDPNHDALCIMTWKDEAASQEYFARIQEPDSFKQIMDDDANFVDRPSTTMAVLGSSHTTSA